jgi:hypothetical protein
MNALEELDAPGEWYLDRAAKRLYFYPEGDMKLVVLCCQRCRKPLGARQRREVCDVRGTGIEYAHADAIVLTKTEGVEVAGCRGSELRGEAACPSMVSANIVRSCDVFQPRQGRHQRERRETARV